MIFKIPHFAIWPESFQTTIGLIECLYKEFKFIQRSSKSYHEIKFDSRIGDKEALKENKTQIYEMVGMSCFEGWLQIWSLID